MEIMIRPYKKRDKEQVLQITEESFEGFCIDENVEKQFGRVGDMRWQERKRDGVAYDLDAHPSDCFVAELDGGAVGYVCTRLYRHDGIGHVANIAIALQYQGMGIGKELLGAALRHFRQEGIDYARIETLEQNFKGQEFYPSIGFREVARQIYYFMKL